MRKRTLALIAGALMAGAAAADAAPFLLGDFGHEFTRKPTDIVWSIRPSDNGATLLHHGDGSTLALRVMTSAERARFWTDMMWPPATSMKASCLKGGDEVFCTLPTAERKKISWLKDAGTDFFHFDPMGGLMTVRPIQK